VNNRLVRIKELRNSQWGTANHQTSRTCHPISRSRAREGRGISVAPEVQTEPEVETRPEPEIATCEEGLGATRSYPTDTCSWFTFAEIVTAHISQEVTETSLNTAVPSQTSGPRSTMEKLHEISYICQPPDFQNLPSNLS